MSNGIDEFVLQPSDYPLGASEPRLIREAKSSAHIHGKPFSAVVADEQEQRWRVEERQVYGNPYQPDEPRPAPGVAVVVSDDMLAEMMYVLIANGLNYFEARLSVDFYHRQECLPGIPYVAAAPVSSELLACTPRYPGDMVEVVPRIALVDPELQDSRGQSVEGAEISPDYVEAVLNVMNPRRLVSIEGEHLLNDQVPLAGENAEPYRIILGYMTNTVWKDRATPRDPETLRKFVSQGILHEVAHALILHLPDFLFKRLHPYDRAVLESFSYDRWQRLLIENDDILYSAVFVKNMVKALKRVEGKGPGTITQDEISRHLALETLCDRMSMFLYENSRKIAAYREVFGRRFGDPMPVEILRNLEEHRREGRLRQRYPDVSAEAMTLLEQNSQKGEQAHVYVDVFGDPPLTSDERAFFGRFLDLLKDCDTNRAIMRFSERHVDTSRIWAMSVPSLSAYRFGDYSRDRPFDLDGNTLVARH